MAFPSATMTDAFGIAGSFEHALAYRIANRIIESGIGT
jgi:hypothetical protein